MDRKTLKIWRLMIPGIMGVLYGAYYYSTLTATPFIHLDFKALSIPLLFAIAIGALFYLTDIRFIITNFSHKKIDLNIKHNIIKLYTDQLTDDEKQFLYNNNRLKDIFYRIIDNDESLKARQNNIYFNGLLWTSTADLFLISTFFAIIFAVSFFICKENSSTLLLSGFGSILIALISGLGHILAYLKHIKLSNDQLEYIETHFIIQVNKFIKEILQRRTPI